MEKLYIGFMGIGLRGSHCTHRLHLRVVRGDKLAECDAEDFAESLCDAVRRCNMHVRVLDYDKKDLDTSAAKAEDAYYMAIWAGRYETRKKHLDSINSKASSWASSSWSSSYGKWLDRKRVADSRQAEWLP